jgi:4-amino-4-deoxy-L-arabinose transferase-like glycosyltransferase
VQSQPKSIPGRSATARGATGALCALLIGAAIVVNQSAIHWRGNIVDSDLFAYHGWCLARGQRPYRDFWDNKPPGIWLVNAAAIGLGGPGPLADVLVGATALALACGALVVAAARAYGPGLRVPAALAGAVLLTHQGFECGANRTETWLLSCELLAVCGYLAWLRGGRWRALVIAGLAGGAAPLFKQSGVTALLACGTHLAWTQWRGAAPAAARVRWQPWAVLAFAAALPAALTGVWLGRQGVLGEALFAVGPFNRAYFTTGEASWTNLPSALAAYAPLLLLLVAPGVIAAGGLALALRPRTAAARPAHVAGLPLLSGVWLLASFYLAGVSPGRQGHHLMPILAPLAMLTLHALVEFAGGADVLHASARRAGVAVAAVLWLAALGPAAGASLRAAEPGWASKPHWYALARREPWPAEAQGRAVAALCGPDDPIFVSGWSPGTYRYAERVAASRFATFEKRGQLGPQAQFIVDEALADLRRTPPAVFVIAAREYAALQASPGDAYGAWIAAQYEPRVTIAGMTLFTRRP